MSLDDLAAKARHYGALYSYETLKSPSDPDRVFFSESIWRVDADGRWACEPGNVQSFLESEHPRGLTEFISCIGMPHRDPQRFNLPHAMSRFYAFHCLRALGMGERDPYVADRIASNLGVSTQGLYRMLKCREITPESALAMDDPE